MRIYQLINSSWVQVGDDIDGENAEDQSGYAVSLSFDGTKIAVGARYNDGINGIDSGHTRIYQLNNSSWIQLGNDIDGEYANDESGYAVSISPDGTTVAVGSRSNSGNAGHVRIFRFEDSEWVQVGNDIEGTSSGIWFGESVSLSGSGHTVAIGAPYARKNGFASGSVGIYRHNGSSWMQVGSDIDGESGDRLGHSVSLSADGMTVALGGVEYGTNGYDTNDSGKAKIYQLLNSDWSQIGDTITGEHSSGSGYSLALSANANIIAVSASGNDDNGTDSGHTRIFQQALATSFQSSPIST